MRVLIAPDAFAGTLTAPDAAAAMTSGWLERAPRDTVDQVPMSDGGPGFVEVLHASLGGTLHPARVSGPTGAPVTATWLQVGETAYLESAQVCGLHLCPPGWAERATTAGVGELLRAALAQGIRRVVIGLGGSGTTDGGAGLLGALGATADSALDAGPAGLAEVTAVDLAPARSMVEGIEVVIASDVDAPLTGLFGAVRTFGPQKELPEERLPAVDAILERYAAVLDRRAALTPGAGAAGGLGFALLCLGGTREPGIELVARATGLAERVAAADLVLTGEGSFDVTSRAGKVPYGVAQIAAAALRPCVVLAGQVHVGARESRALGIESAYGCADLVGLEESLARPAESLAALARRVAGTWSH